MLYLVNGGGNGTGVEPSLPPNPLINYKMKVTLLSSEPVAASCLLRADGSKPKRVDIQKSPVVGGVRSRRGNSVFGHSLRLASRIKTRDEAAIRCCKLKVRFRHEFRLVVLIQVAEVSVGSAIGRITVAMGEDAFKSSLCRLFFKLL